MSIQEINGNGPKKRKKSIERICDNELITDKAELNVLSDTKGSETKNANVGEHCKGKKTEKVGPVEDGEDTSVGTVELLHWRDMPQHLQFNPYVLTGYRPLQTWAGCLRSLFYFHNETINILTHGELSQCL